MVKQGIDRIALAGFASQVSRCRRRAQTIGDHDSVRQAVEVPQALGHIRARLAEEQSLAEIPTAGQLDVVGFLGWRLSGQLIKARAVLGCGPRSEEGGGGKGGVRTWR